ncbi:MAG: DUF6176 family protein [Chitinophagales bacterium]
MRTTCVKIKLKPNSLDKVEEWSKTLNERREEVIETLVNETVLFESSFLDVISEDEAYLIGVMVIDDIEKCKNVVKHSTKSIDKYHKNFKKETWGEMKTLKTLGSFSTKF